MTSPSPPTRTTTTPSITSTATTAVAYHHTYWCHECDMSILLPPPPPPPSQTPGATSLVPPPPRCPHCQSCYLEHMDSFPLLDPQPRNLYDPAIWGPPDSSPIFPSLSALAAAATANPAALAATASAVTPPNDNFLLNSPYIHRLIHHLTNTAATVGGGGNFYDPTPINPLSAPASKTAIESLKTIRIDRDLVENCPICKDQFCFDTVAKELPCKHHFHHECIVPWLEINNTCPLCRFKLETREDELGGVGLVGGGEAYVGAMRLEELVGGDDDDENEEFRHALMRIERGGVWHGSNGQGRSEGGGFVFSPTQIGEAGTGAVAERANSVETVSSWPVWQAEGEREVGTSDAGNAVRA